MNPTAHNAHREKRDDVEDNKESSSEDEQSKESWCWLKTQGRCLCGDGGNLINKFNNSFLRVMKLACPFSGPHSWKRQALGEGMIFMQLGASPLVTGDADAGELAELWGLDELETIYHISHQTFAPYSPMLQVMTVASEAESLKSARVDGEICLKARVRRS